MLSPLSLSILAAVLTVGHETEAAERVIRVSGDGTATAVPDMATIRTGVVTRKPSAVEAIEANSRAMQDVIKTLKDAGVAEKDIQTSDFNVRPVYERDRDGRTRPEVQAYEVSNQVRVVVRNLDRLGSVLDAVVKAGGNRVSGIEFEVSDPKAALDTARKQAVADARRRAAVLAREAGVEVGKVISISEQSHHVPRPQFGARMAAADASSVPIQRGENEFRVGVQMTFAIADAKPR